MHFYPADTALSSFTSRRLPQHLSRHKISDSKVLYKRGSWGEYVSQWGVMNGFGYEYNLFNLKQQVTFVSNSRRSFDCLFYLLKGMLSFEHRDKPCHLFQGNYYVLHIPDGNSQYELRRGHHCWFVLLVKSAYMFSLSKQVDRLGDFKTVVTEDLTDIHVMSAGRITRTLRQLISGITGNQQLKPERELTLGAHARGLLAALVKALRTLPLVVATVASKDTIAEYIEQHMDSTITIETIARHFAVNETAVKRLFRKHFDATVHGYILQQRLINARTLLLTTSDSVYFIALRTGFSDPSHFVKCFKNVFGVTPAVFRKVTKRSE
ncbi:MAG: helix-turn-helix transcriptional regulator [Agriterribacter sp.]